MLAGTWSVNCLKDHRGKVQVERENVGKSMARTAVDRKTSRLTDGDRYARRNVVVRSAH
jgi:hypothetical protein